MKLELTMPAWTLLPGFKQRILVVQSHTEKRIAGAKSDMELSIHPAGAVGES